MRTVEQEPTAADLAAIAEEWPVITAELAVVTAECRLAASPDEVTVRAHRRAVAALNTVTRRAVSRGSRVAVRRVVGGRSRSLTAAASASVAA